MPIEKDRYRRTPEAAGHIDHRKLPKGPFGRALCRQCGDEVPYPRRSFCSDECVHEWKITTSPVYAAEQVFVRDAGVCALCQTDCPALLAELKKLRTDERRRQYGEQATWIPGGWVYDAKLPAFQARCDDLRLSRHLRNLTRRLWEMDHVVPVVEGGGSAPLQGLRTLCFRCHRRETAALRGRLAAKRQAERSR